MIILIDEKKKHLTNPIPFQDKKIRSKDVSFLNLIKSIYEKSTNKIIVIGQRLNALPPTS